MKMVRLLIVTAIIFLGTHLAPVNCSTTFAYWSFYCAGGNFTPSSTYARSLDNLAAELPKRVASSHLLFAGFHSGDVHTLAQCRRDSSASACASCIAGGLKDAMKVLCGFRKGAVIFREMCSVAYYEKELVQYPTGNELDITASYEDFSPIILQSAAFNTSVRELTKAVARSTVTSPAHFGTGQKDVIQAEYRLKIYGLAQCLPSMSAEDCDICLQDLVYAIDIAIETTTGRVAKVWCSYRFALYKFFRGKPALVIPADGLPRKRGTKKHRQNDDNTTTWAVVAVLVIISLLSVVAGLIYWWRNRKQQNKSYITEIQCTGKAIEVAPCPSAIESFNEIIALANNKEIAVFLDYDGTLSPIVNDPEKAYMNPEMRQVVQAIAENFKTSIISGRGREKVFDFVQINAINYVGNHGNDIKMASTTQDVTTSGEITTEQDSFQPAKEFAPLMNQVYNSLVHEVEDIDGATVENKVFSVTVHFRNVAKEDFPRVRPVVEEVMKNLHSGLQLQDGDNVYEVLPPKAKNKGDAVCYILDSLGLDPSTAVFCLHIGDDKTDEDAFKVIRDKNMGIGILVSKISRQTNAHYSLKDPPHVMEFLELLVKWKRENIK